MGKWNRRYTPRKKYHQQTPPSPPTYYETEYKLRGTWKNSELPWEERFCISVGIPWQKVVLAKRYMHCHDNVAKWSDSAGEETFCNAKNRFWAEINGLPCDAPLPDPDMFIDEIDWNPEIDPELITELDRAYFNPDERNIGLDDKNPGTSDNPWEGNHIQGNGALDDVSNGWDRWGNSTNKTVHNPWERGNTQDDKATKDNSWGGCVDKSWDWNQGLDNNNNCGNPWDHVGQSVGPVKEKGWANIGNNSGWNSWDEMRNSSYVDTHWETQAGGVQKCQQWRDCRDERWESQGNVRNHFDYRRHNGSGWAPNGGCWKREGSQQYNTSRYKSSRFQADDYGTVNQWGQQRTQKRVSFAFD